MQVPEKIMGPLAEGMKNERGGEVVIRSGAHMGRIYVCNGKIAWVVCDTIRARLRDALDSTGVRHEDLEAAIKESQAKRRNFGETLIEWGLLDSTQLRICLLQHNAAHFRGLIKFADAAQAMFIPQARQYSNSLLYSIEELLEAADLTPASPQEDSAENRKPVPSTVPADPPQTTEYPARDLSPVDTPLLATVLEKVPDSDSVFLLNGAASNAAGLNLSADELAKLSTSMATLFEAGFRPFDREARGELAREALMLFEDGFVLARATDRKKRSLLCIRCNSPRNFGMSLGMAKNAIREILGD